MTDRVWRHPKFSKGLTPNIILCPLDPQPVIGGANSVVTKRSHSFTSMAQARTICTAIADAKTGARLMHDGDCGTRFTPASTFKVALSVLGYDTGFLQDEHSPTLGLQGR
jgi:beta-lactamase class D